MMALRDQLLGALIGLARASESKELTESAGIAMADGLCLAYSEHIINAETETESAILTMIDRLHAEKDMMAPDCAACQYPCGRTFDYDMEETYGASEPLRDAKLHLMQLLGKIASSPSAKFDQKNRQFLSDALFQVSCTYTPEQLSEPIKTAEEILHSHS